MPLEVFPHESFAQLVNGLRDLPRPAVLSPIPVVIPSLPFRDNLQRAIADMQGICMGLDFLTPQTLIHRAIGPGEESPWAPGRLLWHIFPHVPDFEEQLGLSKATIRERFSLARVVADRFDQYMHYRPEMLAAWDENKSFFQEASVHEGWQRNLWKKLCANSKEIPPSQALKTLESNSNERHKLSEKFPHLVVIGAAALDPLLVRLLRILAEAGSKIRVHVLLPSLGYLMDLRNTSRIPPIETDLEEWDSGESAHPLIASLGRSAVSAFALLGELDEQYSNWPTPGTTTPAQPTSILACLQASIRSPAGLAFAEQIGPIASNLASAADASLQIHSCFGPQREMEAARDVILRAFAELENLKPHEIHIVAPDLKIYAPIAAAVLANGDPPLPISIPRTAIDASDPATEAILALLKIVAGECIRISDVLELLRLPAVQEFFETDDIEVLCGRLVRSGFARGTGSDRECTLGFAINRLVAGRWFGASESVAQATYPAGSNAKEQEFILPVADELGIPAALNESFVNWLATLEKITGDWKKSCTAAVWAERIESACGSLFALSEDARLELLPHLSFLRDIKCTELMDAAALADWLEDRIGKSLPPPAPGCIGFGTLRQFQNLPCRLLIVLGMQDSNFPSRERSPSWDLLRAKPSMHDRQPSIVDRQLFLDALLTPTERLVLLASNKNPANAKEEPFSTCVDEVRRALKAMGLGDPVVSHRLQPFSPDYFTSESACSALPQTFNHAAAEAARLLQTSSANRVRQSFFRNPFCASSELLLKQNAPLIVTTDQLAAFLKNPAAHFLKALGIRLASEEIDEEALNSRPLALDALSEWNVKRDLLNRQLKPGFYGAFARKELAANRTLPPGYFAEAVWEELHSLTERIAASVRRELVEEQAFEFQANTLGAVSGFVLLNKTQNVLLYFTPGKVDKAKHFLSPWIKALLASACGHSQPMHIYATGYESAPLELKPIDKTYASDLLRQLLQLWIEGLTRPVCFAPETSDAIAKSLLNKNTMNTMNHTAAALEAGRKTWDRKGFYGAAPGESHEEHAALAWRGRDPFDPPEEWIKLADAIAKQLRIWSKLE
jgi:exodeoxyribonuclease V gamma subunit